MKEALLKRAADNIRVLTAAMVEKAKSGHPGGAMGGADFVNALFSSVIVFDPEDGGWIARDRFFLDPGHMSPMLYSVLAFCGKYSMEDLSNFRQWGSVTPGHPEFNVMRGVENSSGPLGQGHTMAVGAAIAERFFTSRVGDWFAHKTYAFISDGGIQEEISQGAGRVAGTLGLGNLIMFYDANEIQLSTSVSEVTDEDTAAKYRSWNWDVYEVDGQDAMQILAALEKAKSQNERPSLIIGHTTMGKGALASDGSSMESQLSTHGQPLSKAGVDVDKTIANLGGDPKNPFCLFEETRQLYSARFEELRKIVAERKSAQKAWEQSHPDEARWLKECFEGKVPNIDFAAIEQKADKSTRAASSSVLAAFAERIPNMIVSSADLSNSDKTDGFLKKTHAFKKGDFTGQFLQAGVSELTMGCIMNGMAVHGGILPVCATFFVFSDYMKPAMRMAALMELPVKYVFSHDAFRVGEDGPTHQPVEQEAQARLLEELKNHSGRPSMLVLRPADVNETTVAWQMAMENDKTPTMLILSRQDVKNLPDSSYEKALQAKRGAYIVTGSEDETPDVVMIANGSEVSTLVSALPAFQARGIKVRIVSLISPTLFAGQDEKYRKSIIPDGVKEFGLTAGLPSSLLAPLLGLNAKNEIRVFGLDHFGYSAPYTVLDDKFGFNADNVVAQVEAMLK
ncbi:MAG: transketolase [Paludibacteraceae bacterium]|nr:transketolase [Paludibacteraceae bacterium]